MFLERLSKLLYVLFCAAAWVAVILFTVTAVNDPPAQGPGPMIYLGMGVGLGLWFVGRTLHWLGTGR